VDRRAWVAASMGAHEPDGLNAPAILMLWTTTGHSNVGLQLACSFELQYPRLDEVQIRQDVSAPECAQLNPEGLECLLIFL
jgi:hypothetical protein